MTTIAETNARNMRPRPAPTRTSFDVVIVTLERMINRRKEYGRRTVVARCETAADAIMIADAYRDRLVEYDRDCVQPYGVADGESFSNSVGSIRGRWADQIVQVVKRTMTADVAVLDLDG